MNRNPSLWQLRQGNGPVLLLIQQIFLLYNCTSATCTVLQILFHVVVLCISPQTNLY